MATHCRGCSPEVVEADQQLLACPSCASPRRECGVEQLVNSVSRPDRTPSSPTEWSRWVSLVEVDRWPGEGGRRLACRFVNNSVNAQVVCQVHFAVVPSVCPSAAGRSQCCRWPRQGSGIAAAERDLRASVKWAVSQRGQEADVRAITVPIWCRAPTGHGAVDNLRSTDRHTSASLVWWPGAQPTRRTCSWSSIPSPLWARGQPKLLERSSVRSLLPEAR